MSAAAPAGLGSAPGTLRLTLRRVLAGAAVAAVVALVIVRAAVVDRTPLHSLAVHALWFERTKVDPGQTVTRELHWVPDRDVYVVGWNPVVLPLTRSDYAVELTLSDEETRIFVLSERGRPPGDAEAGHSADLPDGTGYHVPAGRRLTLRLRIANEGAGELVAETPGAQIRCVPSD